MPSFAKLSRRSFAQNVFQVVVTMGGLKHPFTICDDLGKYEMADRKFIGCFESNSRASFFTSPIVSHVQKWVAFGEMAIAQNAK